MYSLRFCFLYHVTVTSTCRVVILMYNRREDECERGLIANVGKPVDADISRVEMILANRATEDCV